MIPIPMPMPIFSGGGGCGVTPSPIEFMIIIFFLGWTFMGAIFVAWLFIIKEVNFTSDFYLKKIIYIMLLVVISGPLVWISFPFFIIFILLKNTLGYTIINLKNESYKRKQKRKQREEEKFILEIAKSMFKRK